jgi:hypothetical protein
MIKFDVLHMLLLFLRIEGAIRVEINFLGLKIYNMLGWWALRRKYHVSGKKG